MFIFRACGKKKTVYFQVSIVKLKTQRLENSMTMQPNKEKREPRVRR